MPTNTTTTTSPNHNIKEKDELKFHLRKGDLFKGLQIVQAAISPRSTLPILSNVLFELSDQGLRLSATDLEVGVRTWIKADVVETGSITIPAKILSDFLKTLDDDKELDFTVSENHKVEIRSGRNRLNVTGLPQADYPVLPEFEIDKSVDVPKKILRDVIRKTVFAASTDETRYVLNGIHFIMDDGRMTAVSTDGRRLAFIQRALENKDLQSKIIVPTKAVLELLRLVSDEKTDNETVKMSFTENQASFSDAGTVVLSRLIEGHFPNFEQVIPKSHDIQIQLDRAALQSSVARAAVGTLERGGSIRVSLDKGTMVIRAAAQGRVEVESEMAVAYEGGPFEIAFNPLYILDVLKAIDGNDVIVEFTSALNPGVIKAAGDDSYTYVMMPMKI